MRPVKQPGAHTSLMQAGCVDPYLLRRIVRCMPLQSINLVHPASFYHDGVLGRQVEIGYSWFAFSIDFDIVVRGILWKFPEKQHQSIFYSIRLRLNGNGVISIISALNR